MLEVAFDEGTSRAEYVGKLPLSHTDRLRAGDLRFFFSFEQSVSSSLRYKQLLSMSLTLLCAFLSDVISLYEDFNKASSGI